MISIDKRLAVLCLCTAVFSLNPASLFAEVPKTTPAVVNETYSLKRLPGSSLASLTLQQDALPMVITFAKAKNKSCKPKTYADLNVENTEVVTRPRLLGYLGKFPIVSPWREVWSLVVCGQSVKIPIDFIPDKDPRTGTTFVVNDGKK